MESNGKLKFMFVRLVHAHSQTRTEQTALKMAHILVDTKMLSVELS